MDGHASGMGDAMSCEYCEPYSEKSVDKRDRFGTGFVTSIDAMGPTIDVEYDDHGVMVEYGIVEIKHCPFCGRELDEK